MRLQANFKLVEHQDQAGRADGHEPWPRGFERFTNTSLAVPGQAAQSIYSNVRARDDAENRAARTVADDLKTRVAIYLSGQA